MSLIDTDCSFDETVEILEVELFDSSLMIVPFGSGW